MRAAAASLGAAMVPWCDNSRLGSSHTQSKSGRRHCVCLRPQDKMHDELLAQKVTWVCTACWAEPNFSLAV